MFVARPMTRVLTSIVAFGIVALAGCTSGGDRGTGPPPPDSSAHAVTVTELVGVEGEATAIAPNGRIAGYVYALLGSYHAAVWDDGVLTDLGTVGGGQRCYAWGVNDRGQVVGWGVTAAGRRVAVRWEGGVPSTFYSGHGQDFSTADAINAGGDIVGLGQGPPGDVYTHAVLWRSGGEIVLLPSLGGSSYATAVNARGQVVGASEVRVNETHAFLWEDGVMSDLGTLGGSFSRAYGINDRGQIVGASTTGIRESHAFLWKDGVMTDLGTLPGGTTTVATGINARGQVVGWAEVGGDRHAFLWERGAMTDLATTLGARSWANAINDSGQVVGAASRKGTGPTGTTYPVVWTVK